MLIARKRDALTGDVLFQLEWAESDNLFRRRRERPGLREFAFAVSRFEDVFGQDGNAVKQTFGRRVRRWKDEAKLMAVEPFNLHRLTVEIEGRRGSDRRIIQDLKSENDVVGCERRAVGEFDAAPKFASQRFAVGRNLP